MTYDDIIGIVADIKEKYDETDPARLCRDMDILLCQEPMGRSKECCKGVFVHRLGVSCITINSELSPTFRRIITAHELGHAVMHRRENIRYFHDYTYFDAINRYEKEANYFAAELLLSDEDVMSVMNEDTTFAEAASKLYVPFGFLDFKFRLMKWKGYQIAPPMTTKANFLNNVEVEFDNGG